MTRHDAAIVLNALCAGSPKTALALFRFFDPVQLLEDPHFRADAIRRLRLPSRVNTLLGGGAAFDLARELDACSQSATTVLCLEDPGYPRPLAQISFPPIVIYVRGRLPRNAQPHLAIVGTRRPTAAGLMAARLCARTAAEAGAVVVSGCARGIDTAAHEGALEGGGATVAVLGCGLDAGYPAGSDALKRAIAASGAIVSEFPLATPPAAWQFPRRNRIIAGLAEATLVMEAGERSGALITASYALDAGRSVLAWSGAPERCAGTHALLEDGAEAVGGPADLLRALRPDHGETGSAAHAGAPPDDDHSMKTLDNGPLAIDDIIERTGLSASEALQALSRLELRSRIVVFNGQAVACHNTR